MSQSNKKCTPAETIEIIDNEIRALEAKVQTIKAKFDRAIAALKQAKGMAGLVTYETLTKLVDEITVGLNFSDKQADDDEKDQYGYSIAAPAIEGTVIERVRHFYASKGNLPATNAEIREAIDTSRGTLAMVIYTTHKDQFERYPVENSHLVHWRLTQQAYEEAARIYGEPTGEIPF